ncbi:hypothetical protein ASF43_05820 [Pseudorhodoferax sp. Leaf267]|nr:hypothetical protein ASF43_05820 [Pseudorhodoferax sp. Leaf267]
MGADAAELGADVMAVGRTYLATAAQFVQAEIDDLTEALSGGSAACDQYVHERPWSAAAAAGAVGFVLGLVLSKAFVRRR